MGVKVLLVWVALCFFRAHPGDGAPPFPRCYLMLDILCFEHDLSWKNFRPATVGWRSRRDALNAPVVEPPQSFFETLHTKLPPNGHQQEKSFFQDL